MQIQFRAARVDHDLAGIVVEKKRNVHALGSHFDPLLAPATLLPFPSHGAVVETIALGNGRIDGVRAGGQAAEFDHSEGGAANLGDRRVENKPPSLQQPEALKKQVNADKESDDAPGDRPAV